MSLVCGSESAWVTGSCECEGMEYDDVLNGELQGIAVVVFAYKFYIDYTAARL